MSRPNPLLSGAAGRCPNCGEGRLFEGFLGVSRECEACGFDLAAADSGDGPAVFVILIAGLIAAFGALFTMFATRSVWVTLIVWLPMTLLLVLLLLRPMKGLMLAAQFMNKASQARND
jgi:uncharacterized protein (DUF983 family)